MAEEKQHHKHTEHHEHKGAGSNSSSKAFYQKGVMLFLSSILFMAVLAGSFIFHKESAIKGYDKANQEALGVRIYGSPQKVQDVFMKYGVYMSIGLGVISLLLLYLLYGIASLATLTRFSVSVPAIMAAVYGWWLVFGTELVFFENRFTTVGNAIIMFLGYPMFYAGIVLVAVSISFILLSVFKKVRS